MVDQEVQNILQEIRERVRAGASELEVVSPATITTDGDSAHDSPDASEARVADTRFAGLATIARTWDRLPPLMSNRRGATARLELWIKARIKRALRWITWEQVNFNAAVHHTLQETIESLVAYEQRLHNYERRLDVKLAALEPQFDTKLDANHFEELKHQVIAQLKANQNDFLALRMELIAEVQQRREMIATQQNVIAGQQHIIGDQQNTLADQQLAIGAQQQALAVQQDELHAMRVELTSHRLEITDIAETQLLELVARCEGLQTQRNEVANELNVLQTRLAEVETRNQEVLNNFSEQLAAFEVTRQQTQTRLADLLAELRERDDRLLQEQRVCFKQLSLEANEATVLKDRVYRELAERLAKLESGTKVDKQSA